MPDTPPVPRDLLYAALLAGAGVAAAGGGPLLAIAATLAGGAAGNHFHDAIKHTRDWYAQWTRGPEATARNFDITVLAARSIRAIVQQSAADITGHSHARDTARAIASLEHNHWQAALRSLTFELGDDRLLQLTGLPHSGIDDRTASASVWAELIRTALRAANPNTTTLTAEQAQGLTFTARRLWERFAAQFNGELRNDPQHGGRALIAVQLLLAHRTREEIARVDEAVRSGTTTILKELDEAAGRLRDRLKTLEELHKEHEQAESERHAILEHQNRETHRQLRVLLQAVKAGLAATPPARSTSRPRPIGPTNIPDIPPEYIHRAELTRAIHARLTTNAGPASITAAVATASGGYGKTVAARLYAHEHAADYPGGRFELKMETRGLPEALASLGPLLNLPPDWSMTDTAREVKRLLEDEPPSLLILDNMTTQDRWAQLAADPLMPKGACRVLVTTRKRDILPNSAVQVPRFTGEQAWTLLARARPDALEVGNTEWVGRFLRAADGLAIAITATAARMKADPATTWEAAWTALTTAHPTLFADTALPPLFAQRDPEPSDAQKARWNALIDAATDALPPLIRRALDYVALLPAELAPKPWLEILLRDDAECVTPGTVDTDVRAAIAGLIQDGVLTPASEDGKLLSLHRLWHARLNERAQGHDRTPLVRSIADCAAARRGMIVGSYPDGSDHGVDDPNVLIDQTLRWELPPLTALCKMLWQVGQAGEAARIGVWLAPALEMLGQHTEAVACLALSPQTDAAVESALGQESFGAAYCNLAAIQHAQGNLSTARATMERSIEIQRKYFPENHPTLGTSYSNLAMIQLDQDDPFAARASMERAIEINRKNFPDDHPSFGTHYSNLALIQQKLGDLLAARESMERSIQIDRKNFSEDHPRFGKSYSNLAMIQKDQREIPGARFSIDRAFQIARRHLPEDHPNFAAIFNGLSWILWDEGDRYEAIRMQERAIAILAKHFGPEHPWRMGSEATLARMKRQLNTPSSTPPPSC